MFLTASQLGISIDGYMHSGEKAAFTFGVLRCSAITPWKSNDKRKSKGELRDNTFIAARERDNLLLSGLPEVPLCYSDRSRKFFEGGSVGWRWQGDGKWTLLVWNIARY